jgi:uncharacterized protein (DUF427 family)
LFGFRGCNGEKNKLSEQCLDRDISIEPAGGEVEVSFNGRVIASTPEALSLREGDYPAVLYVPRRSVNAEILAASDHHTVCPFKGEASYHHLKSGDAVAENAVWYYPDPCPLVEPIRDHVAFWGDAITITHRT